VATTDSLQLSNLAEGTSNLTSHNGKDAYLTATGIQLPDRAERTGCGELLTAADAHRLFVSTSWAGIYIYEAPFRAPVVRLSGAGPVTTTRDSIRFGVRDAAQGASFTVYDRMYVPVATRTAPVPSALTLNRDGTKIGTSATSSSGTMISTVIRVSDGQEQVSVTNPYNSTAPFTGPGWPIAFSPSGNRIAVGERALKLPCGATCYMWNTTYVYESSNLIGTFPGTHGEWANEDHLLGFLSEGQSVVSADGVLLGATSCDLAAVQWTSATTFESNASGCDLASVTATARSSPSPEFLVGRFAAGTVTNIGGAQAAVRVR
jgi:hypothetical protein